MVKIGVHDFELFVILFVFVVNQVVAESLHHSGADFLNFFNFMEGQFGRPAKGGLRRVARSCVGFNVARRLCVFIEPIVHLVDELDSSEFVDFARHSDRIQRHVLVPNELHVILSPGE